MRSILLVCLLSFSLSGFATTYYYVGGTGATVSWNTATTAWSTAGVGGAATGSTVTPTSSDIFIFDGSDVSSTVGAQTGAVTVNTSAAITVGQLIFQNSANVTYSCSSSGRNISINGLAGTDFDIQTLSTFTVIGSTSIIQILTGATGSISGSLVLGAGSNSQSITAADASGLTINSGGSVQTNSNVAAFGAGTANSVVFTNNSTYIHASSAANPFQLTAPSSVVVFQTGSLFKVTTSASPSMSGRTYANFEWANTGSQSPTGSSAVTMDNLTISAAGTLNLNLTGGVNIKGNIAVNAGTLTFTPASAANVTFNGSSAQTISKTGTLTLTGTANVVIANTTSSVTFNNSQTISGTTTVNSGAILATSGTLTTTGTATINGSLQLNSGGSISAAPTYSGTSSGVIYNQGSSVSTGNEWNAAGPTVGVGVPQNVTVQNSGTTITLGGARSITGNLTLTAGTFADGGFQWA